MDKHYGKNALMELDAGCVLKDRRVFENAWTPQDMVDRVDAYRLLRARFDSALHGVGHATAAVCGPVGNGKTLLARRFAQDFAAACKAQGRQARAVYVDCLQQKTLPCVLLDVGRQLGLGFPDRGYSASEILTNLHRYLATKDLHLVLVLDEVRTTFERGPDLGRLLSRMNPDPEKWHGISVILVDVHDPRALLTDAGISTFGRTSTVRVEPYGAEAMLDILRARASQGLRPCSYKEQQLASIARAAAEHRDARYGIEVLRMAAVRAEQAGSRSIRDEDVAAALRQAVAVDTARVETLPETQRRVLAAVQTIASTSEATTGQVEEAYRQACAADGAKAVGHTQVWKHLKALHGLRLIQCRLSGVGQAGTTQLIRALVVEA